MHGENMKLNFSVHLGNLIVGLRKICRPQTWLQIMGLMNCLEVRFEEMLRLM